MMEDEGPGPGTLSDYETLARACLPGDVWDFIAGGAGDERTVAENLRAFTAVRLRPRALAGVSSTDTAITLLGQTWSMPVAIAPMAFQTLVHPDGELAVVRAAGAGGVPVVISMLAGRSFEELGAAAGGPLWLQVYMLRDRGATREIVIRAREAGFRRLMLTADLPRMARRPRDLRNGFRLPPGVVAANLPRQPGSSPWAHSRTDLDPALDWSVIGWLREVSGLPVLVKGILSAQDAASAFGAGADAIVVSNHGGRQLDGAPAALAVLPEIAAAAGGRWPVLVDGGIRRGADVVAALALGARAVLIGRPALYGLAVGGESGVSRALRILQDELADVMMLTGATTIADIGPGQVFRAGGPVAGPAPGTTPVLAPDPGQPAAVPAVTGHGQLLRRGELHSSLSDPVLDTMTFLNEVAERYPEAISFAPGRPYEGFFDVEDVFRHLRRYLEHLSGQGMSGDRIRAGIYQYGPTAGQIRALIATQLAKDEDIHVSPESIVVTVGCQEAMILVLRALFAGRSDVLLAASPCYVGISGAARLLDIAVRCVAEQGTGLCPADVEAALRAERAAGRRVRALYLVPDHANPSGNTLPGDARHELLELAERYDMLLLEDSPYRLVSAGPRVPALKSLDRGRRVVYLGSYSKTAFPGARLGFVVADQLVDGECGPSGLLAGELAKIKSMITVNTPTLSQAVVGGMLLGSDGHIAGLNARAAEHYRTALSTAVRALAAHFPGYCRAGAPVSWNEPTGGFFLTLRVPFIADDAALRRSAQDFGVIWTPMAYFHPDGGGERALRLSFSAVMPERIDEGITRLAHFIHTESAHAGLGLSPSGWRS